MFEEFFNELSLLQFVLVLLLGGTILIQIFHFLFFHLRLILFKPKNNPTHFPKVSVVICAKNEAQNLLNNIPLVMEQDYPEFEVIVVDDSSWDDTEDMLKALTSKYPALSTLKLNEDLQRMTGKKFALTMGIKAAKHDVLLLTDADCKPIGNNWIKEMISHKSENSICLGVSLLDSDKGLWKNLFRFESIQTAVNYLSFSLAGINYMGVGRNLIYDKSKFFEVGGFKKHMHIPGGDDDLFINQVANKSNTSVAIAIDSQTSSPSEESLKKWWVQKKRHLYSSKFYKTKHKFLLGLEPLMWWGMWGALIALLILHTPPLLLLVAIGLRYFLVNITFIAISRKWNALRSIWLWPFWEAFLNIVRPMVLVSNKISKPKKWRM